MKTLKSQLKLSASGRKDMKICTKKYNRIKFRLISSSTSSRKRISEAIKTTKWSNQSFKSITTRF